MQHIPDKTTFVLRKRTSRTPQELEIGTYTLTYIKAPFGLSTKYEYTFINAQTKQRVSVLFEDTTHADQVINSMIQN